MKEETTPSTPIINPTCHLFTVPKLTIEILNANTFERVGTFIDDSHLMRRLLRCKECGQIYFYEFREEIDWLHGEDPQYRTYIALSPDEPLCAFISSDGFFSGLLATHAYITHDWPSDGVDKVTRSPEKSA
jgi:hypothetical protein